MTTGKNSKRSKRAHSMKTPKSAKYPTFLDTSTGFYGRLEETDPHSEYACKEERRTSIKSDSGIFQFQREAVDDNGESPLITNKSKGSKKKKSQKSKERRSVKNAVPENSDGFIDNLSNGITNEADQMEELEGQGHLRIVHFTALDDNQILIDTAMQKGEDEGEMKKLKGSKMKQHRKTIDRAFRRGWDIFVANLYSVTFTWSVNSSAGPPPAKAQ